MSLAEASDITDDMLESWPTINAAEAAEAVVAFRSPYSALDQARIRIGLFRSALVVRQR